MALGLEASDERVRELAKEILAGDEYAAFRPDVEAFGELLRWLQGLLDGLDRLRLAAPGLYWLAIAGLLLVACGLLAHVVWTVSLALRMPAPERSGVAAETDTGLVERAEANAEAGRFVDAARQLQLATLEVLLRGGVIELARSEPNRVLRRRLREAPLPEAERRVLLGLLERLEWRLFREGGEDRALYEGWRELHARLAAQASSA